MSNNLKKFIRDNRDEFDDKVPPAGVWEHIEASLTPGKKKKKSIIRPLYKWTMAAAAVLIISTAVYFVLFDKKPADGPIQPPVSTGVSESGEQGITPQMYQFVKMIDMKQEELKKLATDQPELYQKFTTDLTQLDSSYNILKKQLSEAPNRELLLEAMIQNLQLQLNVLNQQLNIINQVKESKKNSHEKGSQSI